MKITLMAVYTEGMQVWQEEIGICSIASFLRSNGYEVQLISFLDNKVNYQEIIDFNPNILGIPVYDINKNSVYKICENLRELLPDLLLCVGGNLPTYYDEEILKESKDIDFVIRGEGEIVFLEIVSKLSKGENIKDIKGITYRENNKIIVNENQKLIENIDTLPFPARDFLVKGKSKSAQISTSRGCISKCTFCASQLFWKKWRGRSVNNIVDELEYIVKEYDISTFNIMDGSFEDPGGTSNRIWDIANEILRRDLFVSYFCHMRAEFHKIANDERMKTLKKSGLCGVCTGLESGNLYDLKLYGKIATHEDMDKAIKLFNKYGINIEPGFINFNPYSTFEGLHENISFLEKYGFASNIEHIVTIYKMYKGTKLYDKIKDDNLLKSGKFNEFGYNFVDKKVEELFKYVHKYVMGNEKDMVDYFKNIIYYATKQWTLTNYYKRIFEHKGFDKALKSIEEFEATGREINKDLNVNVSAWFRELLELAQKGWSNDVADSISNRYLSKDYVASVVNNLQREKTKMYKNLLRQDMKFLSYTLDFI